MWLPIILLTGLLTACGGSGGSDDVAGGSSNDAVATTSIKSGIAVDPYITGAMFEELSADEKTVIQGSAGTSTATGQFSFDEAVSNGSIIRIKLNNKGQHASVNYTGIIKRQVKDSDVPPVIVSPLTTLLANGMTPAEVISMMTNAGLWDNELNETNLYTDPMAALVSKTGALTGSDLSDLRLLQANMAVNAFMVANQNFNYGGISPAANSPVSFDEIAKMVRESLDPVLYQQMVTDIGADFTVGDMANMAVVVNNTAVNEILKQVMSGDPIDTMTPMDNALADATTIAGGFYQTRTGMVGGTTDPGNGTGGTTTPPTTGTPDGQAIFTGATGATCSGCHTVGTGTGIMDLAGDGAKVSGKFGNGATHNGNTLTATEITAVATYFGTTTPGTGTGGTTTPPTTGTPDGQALVGTYCIGCHNIGQGGIMDLSGKGNTAYTNITSGHNGVSMTDLEANAVADYLDTLTPPSDPTAPFVHPYFSSPRSAHRNYVSNNGTSNCVSCHGADLRGSGSAPSCYSCHDKKW
jgi:mono/diheme cytochrome c family protein